MSYTLCICPCGDEWTLRPSPSLGCCMCPCGERRGADSPLRSWFHLLRIRAQTRIARSRGRVFLTFKKPPSCSPQWLCQFTFWPAVDEGSLSFMSSSVSISCFLVMALETGVRWGLTVALICISLMTSDVKRSYLLATCTLSSLKCLFEFSAYFIVLDWATSLSLLTFMHWRRKWQPTPVLLPGESQGRWGLVGCHLWGHTELDTTEAT